MRKKGRILCLLLAVMLSMQTLVLSLPKQVWAAEPADVQTYYVTPELVRRADDDVGGAARPCGEGNSFR